MPPRLDLVGKTFGDLEVLELKGFSKHRESLWNCSCNCGKPKCRKILVVAGSRLASGRTKSCGNYDPTHYKKQSITYAEAQRINNYKRKNPLWGLTDLEAVELFHKPCYICSAEPQKGKFNGIDRLDNSKGYTIENSYPCCWPCNYSKHDISLEMIKKLYELSAAKGLI